MDLPSPLALFNTPLALADVSGRIVDLSPGFETWFPGATTGADLGTLLPAGTLGQGEDALVEQTVLTERAGNTPVEVHIRRHGDVWSVEGRELDGERRRDNLLAFYGDVSRRSNHALAAERDAARELLDALERPVFSVDASGRAQAFAAAECSAFFGAEPHEVDFPAFLTRGLTPGDGVALRSAYLAAFGQPSSVFEELLTILPPTLRPARRGDPLTLRSHPRFDDQGLLTRIVHELTAPVAGGTGVPDLARLEAKLDTLLGDQSALLQGAGF